MAGCVCKAPDLSVISWL